MIPIKTRSFHSPNVNRAVVLCCLLVISLYATVLATAETLVAAGRPFHFKSPSGISPATPAPLLILLHGYHIDSTQQDAYMGYAKLVEARRFLYAYPDGTRHNGDPTGWMFWNGNGCCQAWGTPVDDVGYIDAIIEVVLATHSVSRVFLVGHSNGGILAHRYACERTRSRAPVTGIVSLGGPLWVGAARCGTGGGLVSVLQIQGSEDPTLPYSGGSLRFPGGSTLGIVPSAEETVVTYAARNGCSGTITEGPMPLDVDTAIPGAETTPRPVTGCPTGGAVELWKMAGSGHIPLLRQPPHRSSFANLTLDWLMAH